MVPPGRAATLHLPSPAAHLPAAQPLSSPPSTRRSVLITGLQQQEGSIAVRPAAAAATSSVDSSSSTVPTSLQVASPHVVSSSDQPPPAAARCQRETRRTFGAAAPDFEARQGAALFRVRFRGSSSCGAPVVFWLSVGQCRASTLPLTTGRRSAAHECLASEAVLLLLILLQFFGKNTSKVYK